jgi:hypothetical protein
MPSISQMEKKSIFVVCIPVKQSFDRTRSTYKKYHRNSNYPVLAWTAHYDVSESEDHAYCIGSSNHIYNL